MSLSKNAIILLSVVLVLVVAAITGAYTDVLPADGVFHDVDAIPQGEGSGLDADTLDGLEGYELSAPSILVYHSLDNANIRNWCEDEGLITLWTGYSYLGSRMDKQDMASTDLSLSGSCIEMNPFNENLVHDSFLQCKHDGDCELDTGHDFSMWLIAEGSFLDTSTSGRYDVEESYISKCAVCMTATDSDGDDINDMPAGRTILTRTAIGSASPECPEGFDPVWDGYTFMGARLTDNNFFPVAVGGTGACLPKFIKLPFADCETDGCAHEANDRYAVWMAGTDDTEYVGESSSNVGSCVVCMSDFEG